VKPHQKLFYLLILLLPVQLGKHFWPDWSLVNGLRVDYLSPTLYLTDILILFVLVAWGIEILLKVKIQPFDFAQGRNSKLFRTTLFISGFLLVNCLFSQNQPAALYKSVKILEFILLGIYISKNFLVSQSLGLLVSIPVIYSSLLGIAQFLNQGSFDGIFWWLGERTFNAGTPGIAQAVWNGQLILRPYATFPHPNVLAGFLVVSLLLIIWQKPKFWWLTTVLGLIALFLTFSRVSWVVFGLSLILSNLKFLKSPRTVLLIGLITIIGLISLIWIPIQSESITYRQDLNLIAVKMWQSSPLMGVGLNNFLVRLPGFYKFPGPVYFLQPVHNLYLMILAETGIIGLIGVILFLILTIRRLILISNYYLLITLSSVLLLGLFDHYFYTLQQGQLLFTLILGLSWFNYSHRGKIRK